MSLNRRDLLSLGAATAVGAALPLSEAAAKVFGPRPIDATLEVHVPTGPLEAPVTLTWLHDAGAEIPLWTAEMHPVANVGAAARLDIPADRGVRLRLDVGSQTREIRLNRWGRFEWPVGPEASLAVALAPRAEEVLG